MILQQHYSSGVAGTTRFRILKKIHTLDLAELHSFRLVYFKHKEIFLDVCIV